MSLKSLENKGIVNIGNFSVNDERTIIVVGVARGGTSLIAGLLSHLGVFIGDRSKEPVFEDVKLAELFEQKSYDKAKNVIDEYNAKYKIWAFKRPSSIDYLDKVHKTVRNPFYIFIFKDVLSIANRNSISMKMDIIHGLQRAQNDYDRILKFITKTDLNGLVMSYEKVMQNNEDLINALVSIIGTNEVSKSQINNAKKFINPNSKEYLDLTRITKSIGRIGSIQKDKVIGWGKYLHSNEPAEVELYINNKLVETKLAKDFRKNVLDSGQHPTGYCGYVFSLNDNMLMTGDVVSVKLKDDVNYLKGSNVKFNG